MLNLPKFPVNLKYEMENYSINALAGFLWFGRKAQKPD